MPLLRTPAWLNKEANRRAGLLIAAFEVSARYHGLLTGRSPLHVRAEVRRSLWTIHTRRYALMRLGFVFSCLGLIDAWIAYTGAYSAIGSRISPDISWSDRGDVGDTPFLSYLFMTGAYAALFLHWSENRVYTVLRRPRAFRRQKHSSAVPALCAVLLIETARALTTSIPRRHSAYQRVNQCAGQLARALPALATSRRILIIGRRRHKAVKEHTALVAAAIEKTAGEVAADPRNALGKLAEMSHTIATRCAEHRPGALLDETYLKDLKPIRRHEILRLLLAVTLTLAAAVGISFLNPPEAATPLLIGGIGLLCFSLVYGNTNPRPLELLDSVRGIQRP